MSGLRFVGYRNNKLNRKGLKDIYKEAFPREEKIPFWMLKMLTRDGRGEFYGVYDHEELIGLVYNVYYKDIIYISYLAIDDTKRGAGYGGRILQTIQKKYSDSRIFLCIEEMDPNAENYEQRVRRKAFYESNGFKMLPFQVKEGIVMYDAMGVRRETGIQAKVLNEMLEAFSTMGKKMSPEEKLKEFVGHTPLQVLAGAILGIVIAVVICYL